MAELEQFSEQIVEGLEEVLFYDGADDALGETHLRFAHLALVEIAGFEVIPKRYYLLQQPKHEIHQVVNSTWALPSVRPLIQGYVVLQYVQILNIHGLAEADEGER